MNRNFIPGRVENAWLAGGAATALALLATFGHIVVQASEAGPKRYATLSSASSAVPAPARAVKATVTAATTRRMPGERR